ncbi:hypothetical protein HHUSO_G35084 [Huso huso]|uniref:Lysine-specific metallo-endopeptidase domain-containing protein n=1 Tax=Huso huso TaxID=61971 RepID=A0ABR0Y545_HUSHU
MIKYVKAQGSYMCRKEDSTASDPAEESIVIDLDKNEAKIAENARAAAKEILEDALEKNMYGTDQPIQFGYTCGDLVDPYKFCAIPTKDVISNMLGKLDKVKFKKEIASSCDCDYAYVFPTDKECIVYLCKQFWQAPTNLEKDSQPGTLIHEVSHFLGTEDITYEELYVEVHEVNERLFGKSNVITIRGAEATQHAAIEAGQMNANSLEYEYETVLNHEGSYLNGSYKCCGETKRNSVCQRRDTGHYHLHKNFGKPKGIFFNAL